jgi:opacity protein-like surface antigen
MNFPLPQHPCREPSMRKLPIRAFLALTCAAPLASAQEMNDDISQTESKIPALNLYQDVSPYYLQLGIGGTSTNSMSPDEDSSADFDTGLGFSLLAGRNLGHLGDVGVAIEFEGYYSFANVEKKDLGQFTGASGRIRATGARSLSFLGNLMFDLPLYEGTSLYFGGGLGIASSIEFDTFDTGNLRQNDTDGLVAQAKVGIKWNLGSRSDFLMGYRYFRSEDLSFTSSVTGDQDEFFEQHSLEFNLQWGI